MLKEQRLWKKIAKWRGAQMLFDIAGAGLAFAGETQGQTAAERLANALTKTQPNRQNWGAVRGHFKV